MRNYRTAFVAAVLANIALIAILGGLWWRSSRRPKMQAAMAAGANETTQNSPNGLESTQMAPHEVASVPIQLSPERLQSIAVRMGHVESKIVDDEIRVTGNFAVDETRLSYVQLRYSGYIQKVFADATYQYLNKGQPLFTIYSPDPVATEREYLVAKQNQRHVAQSTVPGVTESAASLLEAATERLSSGACRNAKLHDLSLPAKFSRSWKSILRFRATSRNATRCRTLRSSQKRTCIQSLIFRLFGFS